VPADRITLGMYGAVELRRDRRVEVFVRTTQVSQAN
jgi:hypothetical protein